MTKDEIKAILDAEQARQGISQAEWARRSGMTPQRLSNIMSGSRMTGDNLLALVGGLKPGFSGAESVLRSAGLIRRRRSRARQNENPA